MVSVVDEITAGKGINFFLFGEFSGIFAQAVKVGNKPIAVLVEIDAAFQIRSP
jgi:hypothetical protein